jgi:hypothetical protein
MLLANERKRKEQEMAIETNLPVRGTRVPVPIPEPAAPPQQPAKRGKNGAK